MLTIVSKKIIKIMDYTVIQNSWETMQYAGIQKKKNIHYRHNTHDIGMAC